jgi:hypothetical protein
MWNCPNCREEVDDDFDVCWNCGADIHGEVDPSFRHADATDDEPAAVATDRLAGSVYASPLVISNMNYGGGVIGAEIIPTLVLLAAFLAVMFLLTEDDPHAKPFLLVLIGAFLVINMARTVSAVWWTPLRVELGKSIKVTYLTRSREYDAAGVESIAFENEPVRIRILVLPIELRTDRIARIWLRGGEEIRCRIDSHDEVRLREFISFER